MKEAFDYCCGLGMRLPIASSYEDFKKLYDFMDGESTTIHTMHIFNVRDSVGSNADNYYGETFATARGESWCVTDEPVDPQISADGFFLPPERSVLYSKKGFLPKYKLTSFLTSEASKVAVNYFYCEPSDEMIDKPSKSSSSKAGLQPSAPVSGGHDTPIDY